MTYTVLRIAKTQIVIQENGDGSIVTKEGGIM